MIKTKRTCAGEYKVYRDGIFAGTITHYSSENPKEWTSFDETNEWIHTTDSKKDALRAF